MDFFLNTTINERNFFRVCLPRLTAYAYGTVGSLEHRLRGGKKNKYTS
jgi:hypothetical protein